MIELDEKSFDENLSKKNMLVIFYAKWCPLCVILLDALEKINSENEEKVILGKVDTDKFSEISRRYNVKNVPSAISFKRGKIIDIRPGFREISQYLDMIEHLKN